MDRHIKIPQADTILLRLLEYVVSASTTHECCQKTGSSLTDHVGCLLKIAAHKRALEKDFYDDKELNRALPPRFLLSDYRRPQRIFTAFRDLGFGAWLADLDHLPFKPHQLEDLLADHASQPFSAIHAVMALWTTAQVLYIPKAYKGESICLDLHRDNLQTSAAERDTTHIQSNTVTTPSTISADLLFVIVEGDAELFLKDYRQGVGFQSGAILSSIGPRARVEYVTDYDFDKTAYAMIHERWLMAPGATVTRITGLTGGAQSWHMYDYELAQNASLDHLSLMALTGDDEAAIVTKQRHIGASSKSSVLVKSAQLDQSRSFYRGTIGISQQAPLSEAHQQQRALLLSAQAKTTAIPSLEVGTHDVRCSHGSAAGRFQAAELEYVRSRGFDAASAQQLLIQGFFHDERLTNHADLVKRLHARAASRI